MTDPIKAPLFATLVVGEAWRRLFLEWHLPSLLLADIDVLGAPATVRIYTSGEDAVPLREALAAYRGFADFDLVPVEDRALQLVRAKVVPIHHVKKACQFDAIAQAWAQDRPVCWTYPDGIYAPGSFRAVRAAVDRGARATVSTGISICDGPLFSSPDLQSAVFDASSSGVRWMKPLLAHLHATSLARFWKRPERPVQPTSRWPSGVFAETERGVFANSFHLNPWYFHPRRLVTMAESASGLEGDALSLCGIELHEIHPLTDGGFQIVELCGEAKDEGLTDMRPSSDADIARWAVEKAPLACHRHFFPEVFPLFVKDGYTLADCAGDMAALRARARELLDLVPAA